MRKLLILFIPFTIGAVLFFGYKMLATAKPETTALQVTATPQAEVFIDDTSIGKTPLYSDALKTGQHTVKLVALGLTGSVSFEEKITLRPGVLTVIDRIFRTTEAESEHSIITLEKLPQENAVEIATITSPDNAEVKLDEQAQGVTPLLVKSITVSDHQITLSKAGYNTKTLRIRPNEGYRLTASAKLAISKIEETAVLSEQTEASASATVRILDTPTGFLRVRNEPTTQAEELTRVKPDETFPILDEKEGWIKIALPDESEGWITTQYAKRTEE